MMPDKCSVLKVINWKTCVVQVIKSYKLNEMNFCQ